MDSLNNKDISEPTYLWNSLLSVSLFIFLFVSLLPTQDEPELSLRLVGGASESEGRVEILYNGTWGTVCDNTWDINDAEVVCRHLGFTGALDAPRGAEFGSADDLTPIWLEVGPNLSLSVMHPVSI